MNMNQSPVRIVLSNNPLNRFMSEGEVGKNDMDFQYKFHTVEESKYVVDLIGDDWYNWNPETPVMISAQTGTGKNTFINKTILRSVVTYNREHSSPLKLLLVLNRTALRRQTLIKIAQIIVEYTGNTHWRDELDNYTDSGLDNNFYEMGNICIVTYQYLSSDSGINILSKNIFQYAIFDECHFFTSDALFNPNTDTILNNIVQHCSNAIRIYMSATIETAFEPITRAEYRMWHRKKEASTNSDDIIATTNQKIASSYALQTGNYDTTRRIDGEQIQRFIDSNKKFKVKFYDLERDYSYVEKIQVVSCSTLEETIEKEGGKLIIFVGCREDGKQIKSALEGKNIKTSFLTRDSKTSSVFNDLVKEECFQSQVLIATSVIDNGINIKDEKINNIAIFPFDRVEFLQMFGRLRIENKANAKLHIWVASWEEKELKGLLMDELKRLIDRLFLDVLEKHKRDGLAKEYLGINKSGFDINSQEGLFYSSCSLYTLLESIQRISRILINNSPEFKLDLGDRIYGTKLLKVFYNATARHGLFPDAVCRTLLQLNFAEDMDYLRRQVKWDLSNETDDSFLYLIYQKRIENLKSSLSVRERQKTPTYSMEKIPPDEHPTLSDAVLKKKIRRMEKLRDRFGKTASADEEQYYWLELDAPVENKSNTEEVTNFDALIRGNSVTFEEFCKNVTPNGKGYTCADSRFLSKQGFSKDAIENKGGEKSEMLRADIFKRILGSFQAICTQCDTATKLMNYLRKKPYIISASQYTISSVKSSTTKKTYYFFIEEPCKD